MNEFFGQGMPLTKVECIPGRGGNDHDHGHRPFQQIGTNWRSKRLTGDPEAREWQNPLPPDLADEAGLTDEDGDQVAKRRQDDEDVQAFRRVGTEDGSEEQAGGGNVCREDIAFRDCKIGSA